MIPLRFALLVLVALGLASALAAIVWLVLPPAEIGWHGYVALVLTVVGVTAAWIAFMRLMFYSSRHGYDDAADYREPEYEDEDDRGRGG
jgi:uncharacterized membrane protein